MAARYASATMTPAATRRPLHAIEVPPRARLRVCEGGAAGLESRDFVAVDTETTGLPWHARLVELGAVRFRGDTVIARWRTLVNPQRPLDARVTAIHGITDAMVADAPDAPAALRTLARFCEGATLLAHNAPFDRDILAAEWARTGEAPPALPMLCTLKLSRRFIDDSPRHGLAALAAHLALPVESPHRALADAEQTRRLFRACLARMGAGADLATLCAVAGDEGVPYALQGVVRRARDLPEALRVLRRAKARGEAVTLTVTEGDGVETITGVPRVLLARGRDGAVDLAVEGRGVQTVGFESIARVQTG